MANPKQLKLLKSGVEGWNKWRKENSNAMIDLSEADLRLADLNKADLSRADLSGADLSGANLIKADLSRANLRVANLIEANLSEAYLPEADLSIATLRGVNFRGAYLINANLTKAYLSGAYLVGAYLIGANLSSADLGGAILIGADLTEANLTGADLTEANLTGINLTHANLIQTKIGNAIISKSKIYGVNVWDLEGEFKEQKELIITPEEESAITVDNIKVAQFIYLLLNNKEIRDVINTLTSKTVLILGRFSLPDRKAILDALSNKLREYDLLPIVFDFERPTDKDFTETIKTLAGISYFVIADVTNPKSSPLELQAAVPDYQVPFVPIIQEGEIPFAMMANLQTKYNWVLDTISYDSLETLIDILKVGIIDPAIKKHDELRMIKASTPTVISGKDLLGKSKRGKP